MWMRIEPRSQEMSGEPVDAETVKRKLRFDYLRTKNEPSARVLDGFMLLLSHFQRPQLNLKELLQESTNYIQKQYRFRYVLIGLRTPSDGMYRYEVNTGMREDGWQRQRRKIYKLEDFNIFGSYKAGEISRLTRIYLEEENPLFKEDEITVNRPALLRAKRDHIDDSLEADFVDTLIFGPHELMLGWIEYTGTVSSKLPDAIMIRNIEVISGILAAAIMTQGQWRI